MLASWQSAGWAVCAAVSLLSLGCGAAAESEALGDDAVAVESDEVGDPAGEAGGGSAERGQADVDGPGGDEGLQIGAPIECGGHFPLCPEGMECMPIRRYSGEVGYGHCK